MAFCVVLITTPPGEIAFKLAEKIVTEKKAACVNVVEKISSIYWWEGKIKTDSEALLIAKTDKLKVKQLIKLVKSEHPYTVPEVISLRIKEGNRDYLRWIADSVETPREKERVPRGVKKNKTKL
jgi:periplasmic divalent cation tolerance protein